MNAVHLFSARNSLLPISAGRLENDLLTFFQNWLERRITDSFGNVSDAGLLTDNEIPIRFLWDADKCPAVMLPYLAAAFSLNPATFAFSDAQIRKTISESRALHEIKGTRAAVYKVARDLNLGVTSLVEGVSGNWWKFSFTLSNPLPLTQKKALVTLIEDVAPVRCELVGFDFTGNPHSYSGYTDPDNPPTGSPPQNYNLRYNGTYSYGVI